MYGFNGMPHCNSQSMIPKKTHSKYLHLLKVLIYKNICVCFIYLGFNPEGNHMTQEFSKSLIFNPCLTAGVNFVLTYLYVNHFV